MPHLLPRHLPGHGRSAVPERPIHHHPGRGLAVLAGLAGGGDPDQVGQRPGLVGQAGVLGQTVAKALFANGEDTLGQFVLVNNLMFQVIGVMAPRGASPSGQDQDDVVLVPYATSQLRLSGQRLLRNVTIAVEDVARIDQTQAAVEALLAQRHGIVDFQIRNMASIIDTATETQNTMTILLGSIATGNASILTSAALVILFVLVTSPLSTHAIAQAAHRRRERSQAAGAEDAAR